VDGGIRRHRQHLVVPVCVSTDRETGAQPKVRNGSEDDIRRESEFLFRCYSDPFSCCSHDAKKALRSRDSHCTGFSAVDMFIFCSIR
jgi:hypothetical protein